MAEEEAEDDEEDLVLAEMYRAELLSLFLSSVCVCVSYSLECVYVCVCVCELLSGVCGVCVSYSLECVCVCVCVCV